MYRILTLSLIALILVGSGCSGNQTVKDSWRFTSRQYRSYLNKPAQIDLDAKGDCENYELALGDAVLDVDAELGKLLRAMENSDRNPDQAWVMQITQRFPWLSGVALTDKEGTPVAKYPEGFMKEFDVKPLVAVDPKQRLTALRAYVQKSPLGPEVYIAIPVYNSDEMRGLVVAHFDPRNLATRSSGSDNFMMASPAGVLWSGKFSESSPVGQEKWEDTLKSESCGIIGSSGSRFFWTTRYVGNLPLVYAIPTEMAPKPKEGNEEGAAPAPSVAPQQGSAPNVAPQQGAAPKADAQKTKGLEG